MKSKILHRIKSAVRNPNADIEGLYYPGESTASGIRVNGQDYLMRNGDYVEMPPSIKVQGNTILRQPKPIVNIKRQG